LGLLIQETLNEFTILELVEKVIEMTGSKSKIIFKLLPVDDTMQRKSDNSLAKVKLNWEPKVQLVEGQGKTITYFKSVVPRD